MTKRWLEPAVAWGSDHLLERLLLSRGVQAGEREAFLRSSLTDIERPWERPDLAEAAELLLEALAEDRPIAIYGDYDADGITATAILWRALRAIKPDARLRTYVPHRMEEGYGLNGDALETLARDGVRLVVTVDCGVTALEEADHARRLGLDLIITDHHAPSMDGRLPQARAIVHPALPGREHRFRESCGAAVAWKLAWAIFDRHAGSPEAHRLPSHLRECLSSLLPLAAIGTVADVMPLIGENRALVRVGLAGIRSTPIVGLAALLRVGDIGRDGVDSETIGFRLAPRLNAAGRLGSAEAAVQLLTDADDADAERIARHLDGLNEERRRTEATIFQSASKRVRELGLDGDASRAIVLSSPDWHAGVVGIVCSRLVEAFSRPTILCQELESICKGSGRSIHGFDLLDAIRTCGELPAKSGGHAYAAGLSIDRDRFAAFAEAFTAHAAHRLTSEDLVPSVAIDTIATLEELDLRTVGGCEQLAPFGRGNPRPTIRVDELEVSAPPKLIGKEGQHIVVTLRRNGRFLKTKWWNGRAHAAVLPMGTRVDAVIEPKVDRYLGTESVEAEIRDLRLRRD